MRRVLTVLTFVCALAMSATAVGQTHDIQDLYSTGVDDAEAPLALGATDTHWEVQEDLLGWLSPVYGKTNFCSSCGSIWVDHPRGDDAVARPLAHPNHIEVAAPNRLFSWRQNFTLPANTDLSTATISYNVGFDDLSRNETDTGDLTGCNHTVWLNGTAYPMTASGNNILTQCSATIPAGSAFVAGQNTIEFRISNLATYYGFRWEKVSATFETIKLDIADLYSTGVDDAEAPIALGVTDTHWEVQEDALGWVSPLYGRTNFCSSCGSIWVDHPLGDNAISRPLAHPNHVEVSAPNRLFSWRQDFTIPANADLSTVTISYDVGFDDLSRNATDTGNLNGCNHTVWLNGTAYAMSASGSNIRTECSATIPAGSNFMVGQNTIEFRISNLATYYGFRWEKLDATYAPMPVMVSIATPADGEVTTDDTPTISGMTSPETTVSVVISDDTGMMVETLAAPVGMMGMYTVDASSLVDGVYTVDVTATDNAGQTATATATFTVDATAPTVVLTSPTDMSTTDDTTPTIAGTTEPGASVTVVIYDATDAVVETQMPTVDANGEFAFDAAVLAEGEFSVEAIATDSAGNESSPAIADFVVEIDPGTIAITSPTEGETTTNATPDITGTATVLAEVTVVVDGQSAGTATVAAGAWTFSVSTALAPGAHTVEATNADASVTSGVITFTVEEDSMMTAPVVITSPADGSSVEEGDVTVSGTGEPGSTVVVSLNGEDQTVTVDADGNWSATFTNVGVGEQTVSAVGADGQPATSAISVTEAGGFTDGNDSGAEDDGCGCGSTRGNAPSALLLVFGLLALRVRRRR